MKKDCLSCGRDFETRNRTSYCSSACREGRQTQLRRKHRSTLEIKEYLLIKQREWRARNILHSRAIARAYREKTKDLRNAYNRQRAKRARAAYRLLAEALGGKNNLDQLLHERYGI